jgi:uncharacterized protein with HEPN domain
MTKVLTQYLDDIRESMELIREYVTGMTYSDFEVNRQTQDAVIRRLEIIGEAVKSIPENVREAHPHVPWKKVAGMRDVLVHEYGNVQLETVWDAIHNDFGLFELAVLEIYKTR